MSKLVKCHFYESELAEILEIMQRDQLLTEYVQKHLKGLELLGVALEAGPRPNITGKILSYLKRGKVKP